MTTEVLSEKSEDGKGELKKILSDVTWFRLLSNAAQLSIGASAIKTREWTFF